MTMEDENRAKGVDAMKSAVAAILRAEIDLANPEDLGFLESQVPYIASQVVETILAHLADDESHQ